MCSWGYFEVVLQAMVVSCLDGFIRLGTLYNTYFITCIMVTTSQQSAFLCEKNCILPVIQAEFVYILC